MKPIVAAAMLAGLATAPALAQAPPDKTQRLPPPVPIPYVVSAGDPARCEAYRVMLTERPGNADHVIPWHWLDPALPASDHGFVEMRAPGGSAAIRREHRRIKEPRWVGEVLTYSVTSPGQSVQTGVLDVAGPARTFGLPTLTVSRTIAGGDGPSTIGNLTLWTIEVRSAVAAEIAVGRCAA